MNPGCWTCEEPCEDLGYADASTREDRVELVRVFRCPFCREEYIRNERPPEGWRQEIKAAVREITRDVGGRP